MSTGLLVAGVAGLGAAAYLAYSTNSAPAVAKAPLKSALDKDNFVEFPLKKVPF